LIEKASQVVDNHMAEFKSSKQSLPHHSEVTDFAALYMQTWAGIQASKQLEANGIATQVGRCAK